MKTTTEGEASQSNGFKVNKLALSLTFLFFSLGTLIVFQAGKGSLSQVRTPNELLTTQINTPNVKVSGRVSKNGIHYQAEPFFTLSFILEDPDREGIGIPVIYKKGKPNMFYPGKDVLVEGSFNNGILNAESLMMRCPSKYEAIGK